MVRYSSVHELIQLRFFSMNNRLVNRVAKSREVTELFSKTGNLRGT